MRKDLVPSPHALVPDRPATVMTPPGVIRPIRLPSISMILWIVGIANAINLIDGLDGLASGVVLIAAVTLVIATRFGETAVALSALVLAGCLAGFPPYNLPPARLFLGDTGSLFLGATIAAISLLHNRKGALTITLLLPVVLPALPILDTTPAFGRRIVGLRHPFRGDTEHLHHRSWYWRMCSGVS